MQEAVYELEIGIGPELLKRELYIDNGGYFCFGVKGKCKAFKYVKNKQFYVYVLGIFGKPRLTASQTDGKILEWKEVISGAQGISLSNNNTEVTFGLTTRKATVVWSKPLKQAINYNLLWKMELEELEVSDKIPRFGFIRMGIVMNKPAANSFTFEGLGNDATTFWFKESAISSYPYSDRLAFSFDTVEQKIVHNVLVQSLNTLETEDFKCEGELYLVVELYSGQMQLLEYANDVKQSIGSTYLVTNFDSSGHNNHDAVYDAISAKVKHQPCRLHFGRKDNEFVVEFREVLAPGVLAPLNATVKKIESVKEVQVTGESGDNIVEYDIEDHLSHDEEMGELNVRSAEGEKHVWIVTFEKENDARSVWTENEMVINTTKVSLLPYYRDVGVSHTKGQKPTRIKETRRIDNLDEQKLRYITNNQQKLTQHLKDRFREEISWQPSGNRSIIVEYNGCVESWYEQLTSDINCFFDKFNLPTESDTSESGNSNEMIFKIELVGKVMYLKENGSLASVLKKYPNSRLSTDKRKGIAKLIGPSHEIGELYKEIQRQMLSIVEKKIELSHPLARILKHRDAKKLLLENLHDIQEKDIEVIGNTYRLWEQANVKTGQSKAEMIRKQIKEVFVDRKGFEVQREFYPTFDTKDWKTFKDELIERNEPLYIEQHKENKEISLKITTTQLLFEKVKEEIISFLSTHTKGEQVLELGKEEALFLSEYKPDLSENVHLSFKQDIYKNYTGLVSVRGRVDERNIAVNDLLTAKKGIHTRWFKTSKPWLASAVVNLKDSLQSFEMGNKCIMQLEIADGLAEEMIPCVGLFPKIGCALFVLQSDISAANYDVIVNITNCELQCRSGFSKFLCEAAGQKVVKECKDYIIETKTLDVGTVFISGPGELQCRSIAHVVSPKWKDGKSGELKSLEEAVTNIMMVTDSKEYSSIVLPAIGCGDNGFPIQEGTNSIVSAIFKYMLKNDKSKIREIYLCDLDEKKIDALTTAVINVMKKDQFVFKHGRDLPKLQDGALSKSSRFGKSVAKTRLLKTPHGEDLRYRPTHFGEVDEDSIRTGPDKRKPMLDETFSSGLPFNIELNDSLKLHVETGSIESQQVDVIVNTTAHFPEMGSALSRALLKEGGEQLQKECTGKSKSDFMDGKVVRTSGGNLRCKHVYHVRIEANWDRRTGQERVYKLVQNCLVGANTCGCKSISFPTIGTGSSNFPPDKVADNMVRAVCDFAEEHKNSSIQHVHIVIFYADISTEKVFVNEVPRLLQPSGGNFAPGQVVRQGRPGRRMLHYVKTSSHTDADDVLLAKIIANGDITKIINNFNAEINDLYSERLVSYKDLEKLSESEEVLIKLLNKEHPVSLEIDKKELQVKISGLKKDTGTVDEELRRMLTLTFPQMRIEHEMGERIAATVEWHFENNGITAPVAAPDNYTIQIHYMKGEDFEYKNTLDGKTYKVIVDKLEEYPTDNKNAVRRLYQKVKRSTEGVTLPSDWDITRGGTKTKIVSVDINGSEYQDVKKALLAAGCPVKSILDIKRIEDEYKWFQYMTKKKQMECDNPKHVTNERKLWHGTDADTVDKIIKGGYDRSFRGRNAVAFGDGVYFAVSSAYSHRYAPADGNNVRHMFYNRVLTGEYCQGSSGLGVLPAKTSKNGFNILYDSAVNNMNNPSMYVIFHDTQAYPEYLIEYN
ncbi:Appr-1'-p processing enzyme [Mactra antiquata]